MNEDGENISEKIGSGDCSFNENENFPAANDELPADEPHQHSAVSSPGPSTTLLYAVCICLIGVGIGVVLDRNGELERVPEQKKYWVYAPGTDEQRADGILRHVHAVLGRVGWRRVTDTSTDWTLLWAFAYPYRKIAGRLTRLKSHQRINHLPGIGHLANKVALATTTRSRYIPRAFRLPADAAELQKYARAHPDAMFVEKGNEHREVVLRNVSQLDTSGDKFAQEFVRRPLLVDGHRFDVGVYVVITSVDPLRAYWYKGDVLFRYCLAKYYPLDVHKTASYVVADDYLPTWEVPSLASIYTAHGHSMKDTFDIHMRSQGKEPEMIWTQVQDAIVSVLLDKEKLIAKAMSHYPTRHNFFELLRFDLIIDEDLKVFLLEANMSPNLSSAHTPGNQLLYEQVLYSLFSITGLSSAVQDSYRSAAQSMVTSHKHVAVWWEVCAGRECTSTCEPVACRVCRHCVSSDATVERQLHAAHYEHLHRADFRRLFPPTMSPASSYKEVNVTGLTEANQIQMLWFQGKCNADVTWCT